jgi:hypothetical protein
VRQDGSVAGTIGKPGGTAQPEAAKPNALDTLLEGDNIPPQLRGRKVSDLVGMLQTLSDARNFTPAPQPGTGPAVQPQPRPEEQFQFTEDDFGVTADPQKFQHKLLGLMNAFAEQKLQPFQHSQLTMASMVAQQNAARTLPYYDLFKEEIEGAMYKQPINVTSNPYSWQAVHDAVVRQNIPRVTEYESRKKPPKPIPGTAEMGNGSTDSATNNGRPRARISEEELRYCNSMGVDPKEFVFYRDNYKG